MTIPTEKITKYLKSVGHYAWLICLIGIVGVYGFVAWRINVLSNIQPSPADVSAQLKTAQVPHIDQDALKKIQDLQDNSVSVQSLFDQARNNPFQD